MTANTSTVLSIVVAALVTAASAVGLFTPAYARESPMWAAQGAGQDVVNLLVAVPVLLVTTYLVAGGSMTALAVRTGALVYTVYSYVLYSCFVHFGPWFPLYVATLGASGFALATDVVTVGRAALVGGIGHETPVRSVGVFLVAIGVTFAAIEIADIARAIATGTAPSGVDELGLLVNPVHVLDLAFILPAAILMGVRVCRRESVASLFAVPLLVFFALMGTAILGMVLMMLRRGAPLSAGIPALVFAPVTIISTYLSSRTVRKR